MGTVVSVRTNVGCGGRVGSGLIKKDWDFSGVVGRSVDVVCSLGVVAAFL